MDPPHLENRVIIGILEDPNITPIIHYSPLFFIVTITGGVGAHLISTPKESPPLCELVMFMRISELGDDVGMLRTCLIRVWVTQNACPFFAVLPHRLVFVGYVDEHFSMHGCIIIRVVSSLCCFCCDVSAVAAEAIRP